MKSRYPALALACALLSPAIALAAPQQPPSASTSASAPAQAAQDAKPEQVIQAIVQDLDHAVAGHRTELKKDKKKLIGIINGIFLPHFDMDYASILVLGRYARQATPEQRQRFTTAFYDSITHRYAEGLLNYTKGSVTVLPFRGQLNPFRTIVRTQVMLDDGKTVSVDYAFRRTDSGKWKVYDVIIEGISYITNYRAQVAAEIQRIGLDALIKRLQDNGAQTLETMKKASGS